MQKESNERLTDAQRLLVEENLGLARRTAWKYNASCARHGMDWEDVFSIACLGLIRAARKFDPSQGKASTYLIHGCELAVLMELRRCNDASHSAFLTVSIDEIKWDDGAGHVVTLSDMLPSDEPTPDETVLSKVSVAQIQDVIKYHLTQEEKRVLHLKMAGVSQKEIARSVGHAQSWASRVLCRIQRRVREVLAS